MSFAKLAVIGAVSSAGLAGTYFLTWGADYMPTYQTLNTQSDKSGYSGKFGDDYQYFLVDPSNDENKLWWEWSYRRWLKDSKSDPQPFSDSFKNVKKDESDGSNAAAKTIDKVCDDVYKKANTDVDFGKGEDVKHKLGRDILKYCSPLQMTPDTIRSGEQYGEGKLAKDKKDELISTYGNDLFWELKTEWFNGQTSKPTSDGFFKPFLGSKNDNKLTQPLRNVCDKAYRAKEVEESGSATAEKPKQSEIVKYCSFKKTSQ